MVFSSNVFLFVFLPAALLFYFAAPRSLRLIVLTFVSYIFYGWNDPRFLLLLVWVTGFDFVIGNFISGHWTWRRGGPTARSRRVLLGVSLTNSLGLLAFFKYAILGQHMVNAWRSTLGRQPGSVLNIVLPAGISFYTFESISYVVDIYRGVARPASERFLAELPAQGRTLLRRVGAELRSFTAFACYLSQFPHLVAGPIIRYQELEPQLHKPAPGVERFGRGVFFFSLGLAKKVLLADVAARAADPVFNGSAVRTLDMWWGMLAFGIQIYFDFSGYSDMAIGLALMLGFDFPRNFDAPYKAASLSEFWRRWHMTLSSWLRDYLYIPLGGNRRGKARGYLNVLITMFLGGLWHGASFNFVVWGLYHGVWICIERMIRQGNRGIWCPHPVRVAGTFLIVCIGWVIFRSQDVDLAIYRIGQLFVPIGKQLPAVALSEIFHPQIVAAMVLSMVVAFFGVQTWDLAQRLSAPKMIFALVVFSASVVVLALNSSSPFLYFRF